MTNEKALELAHLFATEGRRLILERYRADSCIVTAKTASEFFGATGIHASVLGVQAAIWNETYAQAHAQGLTPGEILRQPGAWSIGLGVDGIHLALILRGQDQGWLFDPSLDQAARPEKGLPLGPLLIALRPEQEIAFRQGEIITIPLETGGRILYQVTGKKTHTASPNWGARDAAIRRSVVGALIRSSRN